MRTVHKQKETELVRYRTLELELVPTLSMEEF